MAVHMRATGVKTRGFIGFADAYGDGWLGEMVRSPQMMKRRLREGVEFFQFLKERREAAL